MAREALRRLELRTVIAMTSISRRSELCASRQRRNLRVRDFADCDGRPGPRKLDCPGNDLPQHFLSSIDDDSRKIREKGQRTRKQAAVVIGERIHRHGGGLRAFAKEHRDLPMAVRAGSRLALRIHSSDGSDFLERYYVARGVKTAQQRGRPLLLKDVGSRKSLRSSSGRKISCDMVVAGVGAIPVTELFSTSGLVRLRMASSPTSIWKRIRGRRSWPRATWPAMWTRFSTSGAGWSIGTTPFPRASTGRQSLAASDGLTCTCLTSSRTYSICRTNYGATLKERPNNCSRGPEQFKFQCLVVKTRFLDRCIRYESPG